MFNILPKKDIRLVNRPVEDVVKILKDHVNREGWIISEEKNTGGTLRIVATNPRASTLKLFCNNSPQIATWFLYPQEKGTRVEMFFDLFRSSRIWFYGFVISILAAVEYYAFRIFFKNANPALFVKFLLAAALWLVLHSCIVYIKRYREFREGFYSLISDAYGINEEMMQKGIYFPELSGYFAISIFFAAQLLIVGINSLSAPSSVSFFIAKMALFLFIIGIIPFAYICCKPRLANRFRLGLFGMQAGSLWAVYAMFPILNIILAPRILLGHELTFIVLGLALILFTAVFMAVDIFDTARGLAAEIYQPKIKSNYSLPEFSSAPQEDASSKLFPAIILIIWLSFSLINLIGLYFSLSFIEYLFLGKSYIFHNPYLKSFFDGGSFGIIIWGVYSVSLLGIWLVFAYKRARELLNVIRLRSNRVPKDLLDMVGNICTFAGANKPKIVINREDAIAANVKRILFFGRALKISQKTLKELNKQELEALLAHEVFHLKKHSLAFSILNSLSAWTLFGSGFLTLSINSRELEFEADKFSLAWLREKGIGKEVLINLLDKVSLLNSSPGLAFSDSAMSFNSSLRNKNAGKMGHFALSRFIDEMFFGDMVISYVHPTANERIRKIEQA